MLQLTMPCVENPVRMTITFVFFKFSESPARSSFVSETLKYAPP